jgi:hypothetical protein
MIYVLNVYQFLVYDFLKNGETNCNPVASLSIYKPEIFSRP